MPNPNRSIVRLRPSLASMGVLWCWGCGTLPAVSRDYAWQASELNFVPEARTVADSRAQMARQSPRVARLAERPAPQAPAEPAQRPQLPLPRPSPERIAVPSPHEPSEPIASRSAQPAAPASTPPPQNTTDVRAAQRVEAALALLGTPGLQDRAFVAQVLRAAGQDVAVDTKLPYAAALWTKLEDAKVAKTTVRAGDLVFFHDTADLNANGKPDDGVTLVGVVERAHGSRVLFIAQRAGKVRRMAVDPERPLVIRDSAGDVVNTRLVRWPGSGEPWTTGQCLTGYSRPK